ncbi:MAG: flagellar filament capping protein FliD [Nannocystaceae bacterium]
MPAIQFSGLASGLNTTEIINAIMGVERIPVLRIQENNRDLNSQLGIIGKLTSALTDLSGKAEALGTLGDFLSYTGSVSDDSVARATADGDAVPGSYNLEVTTLAAAQRTYSDTVSDASASISAIDDTLTLTLDGTNTEITVAANSTLEDLVGLINGSGANVTAGILFDGSNYRLQVVGNETGASNAITFDEGSMALGLSSAGNTVQAAVDAAFTLDGFAITSGSNTISDALAGVTLELESTTDSAVTIKIEPDPALVKEKIHEFVDAYNEVARIIHAQAGEGKGNNTLNGDSSLRTIESQLQQLVTGAIADVTDANGNELALGRLGIETQRDGSLKIDDGDLDSFLASDFRLAASIFVGDTDNSVDGMADLLEDLIDGFTDKSANGILPTRSDGIQTRIDSNETRIEAQRTYLERFENNLRNQYIALEQTMSLLQSQQSYMAQFLQTL